MILWLSYWFFFFSSCMHEMAMVTRCWSTTSWHPHAVVEFAKSHGSVICGTGRQAAVFLRRHDRPNDLVALPRRSMLSRHRERRRVVPDWGGLVGVVGNVAKSPASTSTKHIIGRWRLSHCPWSHGAALVGVAVPIIWSTSSSRVAGDDTTRCCDLIADVRRPSSVVLPSSSHSSLSRVTRMPIEAPLAARCPHRNAGVAKPFMMLWSHPFITPEHHRLVPAHHRQVHLRCFHLVKPESSCRPSVSPFIYSNMMRCHLSTTLPLRHGEIDAVRPWCTLSSSRQDEMLFVRDSLPLHRDQYAAACLCIGASLVYINMKKE